MSLGRALELWNEALAAELLDGKFEGQPVYIFLEPERLKELEDRLGSELAPAVAQSLEWADGSGLYRRHEAALDQWESVGKVGPPPFLALLVTLTNAAAAMISDQSFAVHNYLDRLCELLSVSGSQADKLKRSINDTPRYWLALNDWLDEWEGERGFPTARVLGRRVNVGFPISQALIRAGDRHAMWEAFERYGLSPGRRIGVAEMTEYIGDWVGRGRAPANLRRLWGDAQDANVRERIAQVACDELEHGAAATRLTARAAGEGPSTKLQWTVELAMEPFPSLELYLTARLDRGQMSGRWAVGSRTDQNGKAAVAACADELELRWLPALNSLSLEPWRRIGTSSLFSGVLELERAGRPGVRLLRSPTAVLVLAFDERDGRYRETSRAQLLERCLVLAYESMADAVDKHLRAYARDGFSRMGVQSLPQLPQGWTAFTDVTLIQATDELSHNRRLSGLCAAPATAIELSGGLRIGQGTWHVARPPEVMGVVASDTAQFRLLVEDRRGSGGNRDLGAFVGRGAANLPDCGLGAGDYEVQLELKKGGGVVRGATLRLRSADQPRPVGVRRHLGLGFDLGQSWSTMSASRGDDEPICWVQGAILKGEPREGKITSTTPPLSIPERRPQFKEEPIPRIGRADEVAGAHSCTIGHHVWTCEPAGPDDTYKTLKWQECQNCHRFEWTRNRGRNNAAGRRSRFNARAMRVREKRVSLTPIRMPRYGVRKAAEVETFNLLLDALSYIGSGALEVFRRLCTELDPDPLFAWRALRGLSALSHIEVEYDRETARPHSWQISPPCLVGTAGRGFVLAGARSSSVVRFASEAIAAAGGELRGEHPESGPTIWRTMLAVEGMPLVALGAIATPVGVGVSVSDRLAERVVGSVPPLSGLVELLPRVQVGSKGLERFDVASAAWIAGTLDRPGAYRFEHWGRTYGFSTAQDVADQVTRMAEPSVVKHLASQVAGQSLLAYDPNLQILTTPLGAELPQLLERVAVACSGTLPRLRSDLGQLEYASVPSNIARTLQHALHT